MKKIAVFGATGQAGRPICQLLLEEQEYEVIACSRTPEKLDKLKAEHFEDLVKRKKEKKKEKKREKKKK